MKRYRKALPSLGRRPIKFSAHQQVGDECRRPLPHARVRQQPGVDRVRAHDPLGVDAYLLTRRRGDQQRAKT